MRLHWKFSLKEPAAFRRTRASSRSSSSRGTAVGRLRGHKRGQTVPPATLENNPDERELKNGSNSIRLLLA